MNQRFVLLASIFLTVFVLVIAGSVAMTALANQQPAGNTQTISPELRKWLAERDTAYSDLITQAVQKIQELDEQVSSMRSATVTPIPSARRNTVTAENAVQIALKVTGRNETLSKLPELVVYEGKSVYEVKLKDGVVYVDSGSGEIVYNNVPAYITEQQAAQIAGKYLGGMNPKYATIKKMALNNIETFKVTFGDGSEINDYIVYVDTIGNVVKAQVFKYTPPNGGGGGGNPIASSPVSSSNDDDHDDDDDHGKKGKDD